jgi:hypothetical protein
MCVNDKKEWKLQHELYSKGLSNFNFNSQENFISEIKPGKNLDIYELSKNILVKMTLEKLFNDTNYESEDIEEFKDSCEVISGSFEENLKNYFQFPSWFWSFYNGFTLQSNNLSKRKDSHRTFDLGFHFLFNYSERV